MNGGSIEEKVDFGYSLFEQTVSVDSVFQPNEMLDTIAITKGKGTEGVVTRWGVTRLPRKTHRGLRKVMACLTQMCMQSTSLVVCVITRMCTTGHRALARAQLLLSFASRKWCCKCTTLVSCSKSC